MPVGNSQPVQALVSLVELHTHAHTYIWYIHNTHIHAWYICTHTWYNIRTHDTHTQANKHSSIKAEAYQDIELSEVLEVLCHVCGQDQVNDGCPQATKGGSTKGRTGQMKDM